MPLQDFADVGGHRTFDVLARDDDHRRVDRIERHGCARRSDDGFFEFVLREHGTTDAGGRNRERNTR